ncbi:LPS translocon maturation chaperone LptM [Marinobacter sediminum]|uniref:LPS translocon maturation chaperone LptM n=1 Tax=Marinobacter sediminum TaxID=256323 RepID=UPI0020302E30|nr:lipoprotein [Marinobacter sediminum]
MRDVKILLTGLVLMMALGGCGQKGPLFREHQDASVRSAVEAVDAGPGINDTRNSKESGE